MVFNKELADWTFEELRAYCVQMELDAIVRGEPLAKRMWSVCELSVRWRHEKTLKENK